MAESWSSVERIPGRRFSFDGRVVRVECGTEYQSSVEVGDVIKILDNHTADFRQAVYEHLYKSGCRIYRE